MGSLPRGRALRITRRALHAVAPVESVVMHRKEHTQGLRPNERVPGHAICLGASLPSAPVQPATRAANDVWRYAVRQRIRRGEATDIPFVPEVPQMTPKDGEKTNACVTCARPHQDFRLESALCGHRTKCDDARKAGGPHFCRLAARRKQGGAKRPCLRPDEEREPAWTRTFDEDSVRVSVAVDISEQWASRVVGAGTVQYSCNEQRREQHVDDRRPRLGSMP